jgi:hypothetical protein
VQAPPGKQNPDAGQEENRPPKPEPAKQRASYHLLKRQATPAGMLALGAFRAYILILNEIRGWRAIGFADSS